MKTITDEEYALFEKLKTVLKHSAAEKTGAFFICGEQGAHDAMGLPEQVLICPAMGLDGFAVYTKTTEYSAPSW